MAPLLAAFTPPAALPARLRAPPTAAQRGPRRHAYRPRMSLADDAKRAFKNAGLLHGLVGALRAAEDTAHALANTVEAVPADRRKWTQLVICLGIDIVGSASLPVPFLTDALDIAWAPAAALAVHALFQSPLFTTLGFAEELLPGTDFVPTATLAWLAVNAGVKDEGDAGEETQTAVAAATVVAAREVTEAEASPVAAVAAEEWAVSGYATGARRQYYKPASAPARTRVHRLRAAPEAAAERTEANASVQRSRPTVRLHLSQLRDPVVADHVEAKSGMQKSQRSRPLVRLHLPRLGDSPMVHDLRTLAEAAAPGGLLAREPDGTLARVKLRAVYGEVLERRWAAHDETVARLLGPRLSGALASRRNADVRRRAELGAALSAALVPFDSSRSASGRRVARKLQSRAEDAAMQFTSGILRLIAALLPDETDPPEPQLALALADEVGHEQQQEEDEGSL